MKTALILAALAVASLILGCSDNNPAEPIVPQQIASTTVTPPLARPDKAIRLNTWFRDPGEDGQRIFMLGWVKYSVEVGDEISYPNQMTVDVKLSTDAAMHTYIDKEKYTKATFISGEGANFVCCQSTDRVMVPFNGTGTLVKSHSINGRADGAKLNLQYAVSFRDVSLQRAWLSLATTTVDPPQD